MSDIIISEFSVTGEEIVEIVTKIENALQGTPQHLWTISFLVMAVITQKPNMQPDELRSIVYEVSRYICALLATPEDGDKGKMN